MKRYFFFLALLALTACGSNKKEIKEPKKPKPQKICEQGLNQGNCELPIMGYSEWNSQFLIERMFPDSRRYTINYDLKYVFFADRSGAPKFARTLTITTPFSNDLMLQGGSVESLTPGELVLTFEKSTCRRENRIWSERISRGHPKTEAIYYHRINDQVRFSSAPIARPIKAKSFEHAVGMVIGNAIESTTRSFISSLATAVFSIADGSSFIRVSELTLKSNPTRTQPFGSFRGILRSLPPESDLSCFSQFDRYEPLRP
jgi:hypothetical protein